MVDNAGRYVSYEWVEGNNPKNPPRTQPLNFKMVQHGVWGELARGGDKPVAVFQQDPSVEFSLTCKLWRWTPLTRPGEPGDPIKVLTVHTDSTRVIPGKLHVMDDVQVPPGSLVGPFIESVNVKMGFGKGSPALLKTRAPDTQGETGDVSSTLSYGFNFGFFGTEPMGGVQADYSHTTSMQLTDYRIRSDSDASSTDHTIEIAMLEGGRPYPGSIHRSQGAKVPPRATSDMTLAIQGLWTLPGDLTDELDFTATVSVKYQTWPDAWTGYRVLPDTNYHRSVTGKWGITSSIVAGQDPPPRYPEGDTYFERTLTWTHRTKVPLALADKRIDPSSVSAG
jgi:hypothetical protein